jgi:hypothetical protein
MFNNNYIDVASVFRYVLTMLSIRFLQLWQEISISRTSTRFSENNIFFRVNERAYIISSSIGSSPAKCPWALGVPGHRVTREGWRGLEQSTFLLNPWGSADMGYVRYVCSRFWPISKLDQLAVHVWWQSKIQFMCDSCNAARHRSKRRHPQKKNKLDYSRTWQVRSI